VQSRFLVFPDITCHSLCSKS